MLDQLPTDIQLEIVEYLRGLKELVHLSTLSRSLRQVVLPLMFSKITIPTEQGSTASLVQYISTSDSLKTATRHLAVFGRVNAPTQTLEHHIPSFPVLLPQLTSLKSLSLTFTRISSSMFSALDSLVQLSELSLLSCMVDNAISTTISAPIHKVTFGFHSRTGDLEIEEIYAIIDNMRQTQFSIFSPPSVVYLTLMLEDLPSLDTDMGGPEVESHEKYIELLGALRPFPVLKHLLIQVKGIIYDHIVVALWSIILKQYPTITHLTLDHWDDYVDVDDMDDDLVPNLRFFSGVPSLLEWFVGGKPTVKHVQPMGRESALEVLCQIDSAHVISIDWTNGFYVNDEYDEFEDLEEELTLGFESLNNVRAVGFRFETEVELQEFLGYWKPNPSIEMVWLSVYPFGSTMRHESAHASALVEMFKREYFPRLRKCKNMTYLSFEVISSQAPNDTICTWTVNPQTLQPVPAFSLEEWREKMIEEDIAAARTNETHD